MTLTQKVKIFIASRSGWKILMNAKTMKIYAKMVTVQIHSEVLCALATMVTDLIHNWLLVLVSDFCLAQICFQINICLFFIIFFLHFQKKKHGQLYRIMGTSNYFAI